MPNYNKKITRQMDYDEFKEGLDDLPPDRQAFLSILFFAGVRVSEALALTSNDISCTSDKVYIQFFRLKGSKQTDPIPIPSTPYTKWLCEQDGPLFPWCRKTGYNIVHRAFAGFYPHFFRQNRYTDLAEKFSLATVVSYSGLNPLSVEYYITKVDIKKVGKSLQEELKS